MGFFSSLSSEGYDRQYSDWELTKRITSYFKPYIPQLVIITLMLLIIAGSSAATPILVSKGLDKLEDAGLSKTILILCSAILAAGLTIWGANWLRRRLVVRLVGDIVLRLRTDAFEAASEHDLSFHDEFASGKIVSRITSDTQEFGKTIILVTDLFSQIIQALILGIVLISIEWRMSLYLFAFLPLLFLFSLGFRKIARKVTLAGMRAMAVVNSTIKETVSGISVAKNFRQEASIFAEFNQANKQSYEVNLRRGMVLSMVFPSLNALGGVGTAILVYVGGLNVTAGVISAGAWFLFLQSLDSFFFPVLNLSAFWAQFQSGLSASERVFALIDAESHVEQIDNINLDTIKGDIQFINVGFRYSDQESVLKDFNLHISPGETVALVGHTGAGKSSIAKLIARFYEYQEGRILIDGLDIRSLNLDSYRSHLGIVSQVPFLFSGTVIDNIRYGKNRGVDDTQVEYLANQIGDGEWLDALPNGLYSEVGERGSLLSMGQRQLVSLIRVLVQDPALFILDEATASIDPFTEWQIQKALEIILENTTSILIAHRLSTVKAADRIIVLDHGVIIEEGSHKALLERSGNYATLYDTYFRHQSLSYVENIGKKYKQK